MYVLSSDLHEQLWEKVLGRKLKLVDRSMVGTLDLFEVEGTTTAETRQGVNSVFDLHFIEDLDAEKIGEADAEGRWRPCRKGGGGKV